MTAVAKPAPPEGWEFIKLSAKVFGHISEGIYRTPAGAIKELISNAFDADASNVKIHTDFPKFGIFSCEDNGNGMSLDDFKDMMDRGFGSSTKRSQDDQVTYKFRRPLIGRLGIGLLSLAQICTEFTIVSHHKGSRKAFEVAIQFPPYTKEEVDKAERNPDDFFVGGLYKLNLIPYKQANAGVRIYTTALRHTYQSRMQQLERFAKSIHLKEKEPYSNFEEFLSCIYKSPKINLSLSLASDYDQLLFGLALAVPVPYFEGLDGNVILKAPFMQQVQRRLRQYRFVVEVDNLRIAKPLLLPSNRAGITSKKCKLLRGRNISFELKNGPLEEVVKIKRFPIEVASTDDEYALYELKYANKMVGGRPLRISGYMFNQTGRLYPREIQGVLIRIKNVAIDSYDTSLMNYPNAEGPRFTMVSMEIFIEEGFEDALNIDRDSFNGLDPHYIRVQSFVHSMMQTIFPEIWEEEKKRNYLRRENSRKLAERQFLKALNQIADGTHIGKVSVNTRRKATSESDEPVVFARGGVYLEASHPFLMPILKRRKYRDVAQQIAIALERALQENSDLGRRRVFYKLLHQIFS
jgi:hypothetical protein